MLTPEPVAATFAGAVVGAAAAGAVVGAAAGALCAVGGGAEACEHAAVSASAAAPPIAFNRSRRFSCVMCRLLSLLPLQRRYLRRCGVGPVETGPRPAARRR